MYIHTYVVRIDVQYRYSCVFIRTLLACLQVDHNSIASEDMLDAAMRTRTDLACL